MPAPDDPHTVPGESGDARPGPPANFIHELIEADNAALAWGAWPGTDRPRVHTRFPPEPNGYLHLGHAKSICLNFGLAQKYAGKFNLRFDDTNPTKEDREYIESIIRDVKWLGGAFDIGPEQGGFGGGLFHSSDYFEQMYLFAEELIGKGKAYVCELPAEEVARRRGTPSVPATSPFRDRPGEESLRLFREMRAGKHPNGAMTLRARIDLASPNFNLRDPVMYRIVHESHPHVGDAWCIYPMYDWAHGIEDSLEQITHSICTLEFENHRPLYDWFIDAINQGRPEGKRIWHSRQIEFARGNLTYTIMSKRFLLRLVEEGRVMGWDDPRMPTLSGARRRGIPAAALRRFWDEAGVTKTESVLDVGRLENTVRDDLNRAAPRAMAVLRPLKVVIENWPEDKVDQLDFVVNPEKPELGKRLVPFSRVIYIEREDFKEAAEKKFFRLAPGQEVRLRWAYFLTCTGVVKDPATGEVTEVRATIDPATRGGDAPPGPPGPDGKPTPGRKVKGTIHWVSAAHAIAAEVRLFDRLFNAEEPGKRTGELLDDLNPHSLETVTAMCEPHLREARAGDTYQFERLGYFCADTDSDPASGRLVFNRTVTLKDSWSSGGGGGKAKG
ncbi:MAG: glutamine--tRNA ligase/YqeY domain fusion protein [Phycisphaerales bacterium]